MKKETLKDWVKGWSVKSIVMSAASQGIKYGMDSISTTDFRQYQRVMVNEINRRIRNAKKL